MLGLKGAVSSSRSLSGETSGSLKLGVFQEAPSGGTRPSCIRLSPTDTDHKVAGIAKGWMEGPQGQLSSNTPLSEPLSNTFCEDSLLAGSAQAQGEF